MVPGIRAGPRCCHFSNILQGGQQNAEKQNLSIRSNFITIIIIITIVIIIYISITIHLTPALRSASA